MPMYDYKCEKCDEKWEENLTGFPGLNVDTTLTPDKKTDGMWSEVMNKINNGLPDRHQMGNDMSGHRWRG